MIGAPPYVLPCSILITQERPGEVAGEEEEGTQREEEEREGDERGILGEMKAIG